ncbi:hypothetical protein ABH945_002360 [Paraburkholderia sp. GAS333]
MVTNDGLVRYLSTFAVKQLKPLVFRATDHVVPDTQRKPA